MDKKTSGLIATIATALLCGCPGLIGLCFGITSVVAGLVPGADIDVFGIKFGLKPSSTQRVHHPLLRCLAAAGG